LGSDTPAAYVDTTFALTRARMASFGEIGASGSQFHRMRRLTVILSAIRGPIDEHSPLIPARMCVARNPGGLPRTV